MEHWEAFQLLGSDRDRGFDKAMDRYIGGRFDLRRILDAWQEIQDTLAE